MKHLIFQCHIESHPRYTIADIIKTILLKTKLKFTDAKWIDKTLQETRQGF